MDKMNETKTKRIRSNKEKTLIKLDIIFVIICIIITAKSMPSFAFNTIFSTISLYRGSLIECINITLAYLWMFNIFFLNRCFIIIVVYLAFRIARMKVIKENCKYEVIDNTEYYRERFNNITPTEISLITDLEIESQKDISATILHLYQKGIIDFNENSIIVKNKNEKLRQSEQKLVELIETNNFNKEEIDEWEKICIQEAQQDNYIKTKVNKEKQPNFFKNNMVINIAAKLLIISFIISVIFIYSPTGQKWYAGLDEFDNKYAQSGKSELEIIENNQEAKEAYIKIISNSGPIMILSTIMIFSFLILIGTPLYRKIRKLIYNKIEDNNRFERTKEGKILVEQIAGIKNYIHDFSMLSEKDKENIVLWEDFLIYAVVLEENEKIVKDICTYKNVSFDVLDSIIKRVINFN